MSDLAEFLLARIAEDEAEAQALSDPLPGTYLGAYDEAGVVVVNAARVLAECEAKRRLVEELARMERDEMGWDGIEDKVMQFLALPYADHPDFQQEWKP